MAAPKVGFEKILTVTTQLFRTKGYSDTSISDIAEGCGIRKSSLYHYVSGKKELALITMQNEHDVFKNTVLAPAFQEDLNPKQRLLAHLEAVKGHYEAQTGGCLMGNFANEVTDTEPELSQRIKDFFQDWSQAIEYILAGQYSLEKAREHAEDAISRIQGSIMLSRLYGTMAQFNRACSELGDLLD